MRLYRIYKKEINLVNFMRLKDIGFFKWRGLRLWSNNEQSIMHYWIGNIVLLFVYKLVLDTARIKKYRKNSILLYLMLSQLLFLYVFKDNYIFHDIWSYLIGFEYSKTIEWGQLYRISSNATYERLWNITELFRTNFLNLIGLISL